MASTGFIVTVACLVQLAAAQTCTFNAGEDLLVSQTDVSSCSTTTTITMTTTTTKTTTMTTTTTKTMTTNTISTTITTTTTKTATATMTTTTTKTLTATATTTTTASTTTASTTITTTTTKTATMTTTTTKTATMTTTTTKTTTATTTTGAGGPTVTTTITMTTTTTISTTITTTTTKTTTATTVTCDGLPTYVSGSSSSCDSVEMGSSCTMTLGTSTQNTLSECLQENVDATFYCPSGASSSSKLVLGTRNLLCEVCSVGEFTDSNTVAGSISGTLTWGPLQKSGAINENMIDGYQVAIVDSCGTILRSLNSVSKINGLDNSCCNSNAYSMMINEVLPANYYSFVIMPEKSGQFISGGKEVVFLDVGPTTTTTPDSSSVDAAYSMQSGAGSILVLVIMTSAVSLMHGQRG